MRHLEDGRNISEVERIFQLQTYEICVRVDRAFAILMLIQWVACVFLGALYSPSTWVGQYGGGLENALVGLVFGALFALPPIYCAWIFPGQKITRFVVAVAQMCFSILLIFLTGGRTETHFHIFISLAALAFYKDISTLWVASVVIIMDRLVRGLLLPLSIYGQNLKMEWWWLELAGWVVIEVLILILGIHRIREELWQMAHSKFQLMRAREEALRFSSLKSSFLSNMSHEIRTPLSSIIGFSDILRDTPLDEEQTDYVGTINRCSETLLRLINDILDISKIENGLLQIDRHRFDIKELHEDIHKMFSVKCQDKNVDLELKLDEKISTYAWGDSHRLRQILMNLVGNAVKFTDKGRIRIEVKKDVAKGLYRWTVSDTGKGIDCDNIKKLFRSFYQEDPSISRMYGGSGLGLMISKNLVELMGGEISVESKLGEGTTFSFSLPLEEA